MYQFTPVNTQTSGPYAPHPSLSNNLPSSSHQTAVNPREKYLNALAAAKAAEAEFLAAEALQREEDALRRRLEEIELLKHREELTRSTPAPSYQPSYLPYTGGEDRLAVLRREIEEEERRRKEAALRQAVEAEKRTQEVQAALLRRRQEQFQQSRRMEQPAQPTRPHRAENPTHHEPSSPLDLFGSLLHAVSGVQPTPAPRRPQPAQRPAHREATPLADLAQLFQALGEQPTAARPTQPAPRPVQRETRHINDLGDLFKVLAGASSGPVEEKKPAPSAAPRQRPQRESFIDALGRAFNEAGALPHPATDAPSSSSPNPAPEAPKPAPKEQPAPATEKASPKKADPASSRSAQEGETLENVLKNLFGQLGFTDVTITQEPANQASSSGSKPAASRPQAQPQTAAPVASPASATTPASLKEQLVSRLQNDESTEIKDTIQAILASLGPSPSATPAPSTETSTGKGKAKVDSATSSSTDTEKDAEESTTKAVAKSFATVRNVEAAFVALESEFVFPSHVDFAATTASTSSAYASDSDSVTSRLAFTAANQPIRFYEQSLGALVEHLDGIESFGNSELRKRRKEVVARVERAIEELESGVEGLWRANLKKEKKSEGQTVEAKEDVKAEELTDLGEAPVVVESPAEVSAPSESEAVPVVEPTAVEKVDTPVVDAPASSSEVSSDQVVEESLTEQVASSTVAVAEELPIEHSDLTDSTPSTATSSVATIRPSFAEVASTAPSSYPPASTPASLPSFPPVTTSSPATPLRPYDVDSSSSSSESELESDSGVEDTFLLPSPTEEVSEKAQKRTNEKAEDSDWSDVEA